MTMRPEPIHEIAPPAWPLAVDLDHCRGDRVAWLDGFRLSVNMSVSAWSDSDGRRRTFECVLRGPGLLACRLSNDRNFVRSCLGESSTGSRPS